MIIDLSNRATQVKFAEIVGISQPAVHKHVENGLLSAGETLHQWLTTYVDHIRNEAAGRGGDVQQSLAHARTEQATVQAALGRLAYLEKVGELVPLDESVTVLNEWASFAAREIENLKRELLEDNENQVMSEDLVDNRVKAAAQRIKDHARKLGEGLDSSIIEI